VVPQDTPRAFAQETADAWYAFAKQHTGSWWKDWAVLAGRHAGIMTAPVDLPPRERTRKVRTQ
jgi:poly(3-hydroxyalkanoate) synthetase